MNFTNTQLILITNNLGSVTIKSFLTIYIYIRNMKAVMKE